MKTDFDEARMARFIFMLHGAKTLTALISL